MKKQVFFVFMLIMFVLFVSVHANKLQEADDIKKQIKSIQAHADDLPYTDRVFYETQECSYDEASYALGIIKVEAVAQKTINLKLDENYPSRKSYSPQENQTIYLYMKVPDWKSNILVLNVFQIGPINGYFRVDEEEISGPASGIFYTTNSEADDFLLRIAGSLSGAEESYSDSEQNKVLFNGQFHLVINQSSDECWLFLEGTEVKSQNIGPRLSSLESWQDTIKNWKDTIIQTLSGISTQISNILLDVAELETKSQEHETRIEELETAETTLPANYTHPYLKYLSGSDRKRIVCGFAEDNNLTYIKDLGYECEVTYKAYRSGRIIARCRCKKY